MGEVADDMLDGTCCQFCGVYHPEIFEGDSSKFFIPQGFPWTCNECEEDDNDELS
jgi:hypothetical protein